MTAPVRGLALVSAVAPLLAFILPIQEFARMGAPTYLATYLISWFTLLWCGAVLLTVLAWLGRAGRVWAVAALVVGLAQVVWLATLKLAFLMWDGRDPQGRPTGGMEVAHLSWGAVALVVGGVSLALAGGWALWLTLRRR